MNTLAKRLDNILPSPIFVVAAKANALKKAGKDIIDLSIGEPDFATPSHIKEAVIDALNKDITHYTPAEGLLSLREASVKKFKRDNNLTYNTDEIIVSSGAKHSLYTVFMALLNPGDEIIIPAPYWTSYPDMARLAEGTPIIVNTTEETYFKITASALEKAITKNTKLFLLNSPSNPTGQVYSHAELKALSEVLKKYPQIYIISDDIYESMYWGKEPFANIAMICPELKDRCLIINGVSKAYAMTGFRIGYTAGPKFIIDAMKKLQSQMTSNPNSLAQMATKTALESSQDAVKAMCAIFKTRYDFIFGAFSTLPFIRCLPSEGAFYLFFNVTDLAERLGLADDVAVANYFLDSLEIALVPGSAFGMPGYLRLSYASDESLLKAAALRMEKALKEL